MTNNIRDFGHMVLYVLLSRISIIDFVFNTCHVLISCHFYWRYGKFYNCVGIDNNFQLYFNSLVQVTITIQNFFTVLMNRSNLSYISPYFDLNFKCHELDLCLLTNSMRLCLEYALSNP